MARKNIIPIFVPHMGCPNHCVFCDQRRISGSPLPDDAADVASALAQARLKGTKGATLAFYGGSFTAIPAREQEELLSAAAPGLADGTLSDLRLSTRPDAIDRDTLERLRKFGVTTIELGSQSMDDGVLAASGRGHTAADTEEASALIKQAGFTLILQMMTGLPGSDDEKDIDTARRIIALWPDGVRIYPTVIVRGTLLYAMWVSGAYREHTVEDAVRVCARILPLFQEAGIPVIRLGLNPTDELSGGEAAGGAYHPALGELVQSEILRRQAEELLQGVPAGAAVTLRVASQRVSAMTGQHRRNIEALLAEFGLAAVSVKGADVSDGEILVDVVLP
jgi:histone acetyltransferase (RNA polymerase elongator complex component)